MAADGIFDCGQRFFRDLVRQSGLSGAYDLDAKMIPVGAIIKPIRKIIGL